MQHSPHLLAAAAAWFVHRQKKQSRNDDNSKYTCTQPYACTHYINMCKHVLYSRLEIWRWCKRFRILSMLTNWLLLHESIIITFIAPTASMYSVLYSPHVVNWRVLDLLHAHGPVLALCDLGASLMQCIWISCFLPQLNLKSPNYCMIYTSVQSCMFAHELAQLWCTIMWH